MGRIPVRFQRVAAAFDEVARVRLCESSGSEHSPESSTDLSDLVKSFIERGGAGEGDGEEIQREDQEQRNEGSDGYDWSDDSEKKDSLMNLFGQNGHGDDYDVRQRIYAEVEAACEIAGDRGFRGFKRRLMTYLREKGFDAGLCKSKWDKSKRFPEGDYEYVDVNVEGTRYIVEAFLVGEFEIARPTDQYASLLEVFPQIFVGKVEELKQIVRLMSTAIRKSMKSRDMPMPPWRRNGYMQTKWFGSYKRTINTVPSRKSSKPNEDFDAKRSVGFETLPAVPYFCRVDVSTKVGLKVGYLTAAFNG